MWIQFVYLHYDFFFFAPMGSWDDEILFQPHLQRTQLCDLDDKELDPLYLKRRDQLKQIVSSMIKPKVVQGRTLNGKEFVSFLGQVILLWKFITYIEYLNISLQNIQSYCLCFR